jgi:hypothetical protein
MSGYSRIVGKVYDPTRKPTPERLQRGYGAMVDFVGIKAILGDKFPNIPPGFEYYL